MRIMVVHSRYRSAMPSGENRVVDQECAALRAAGHEVELFWRDSDDIPTWPLVRRAALPATSIRDHAVRRELGHRLAQARPDVVHLHNTFPLISASALLACRDAGVPAVATLHNYKLLCASGDFFRDGEVCHRCADGSGLNALREGCYRGSRAATAAVVLGNALNRELWRELVSAYIFISASQRDLMRALALPEDRVFVKHNFVPPADRRAGELSRRHSVAYLGRLDAAKGVPFLMRAWDELRARRPGSGLRLEIAGGGPLEPAVRRWASGHPSVGFHGQLPAEEARRLLGEATAAVIPSQWEETFGLVAVEAMTCGVAPLAPGRGSFPELIADGVDGVLFDPADPVHLATALEEVDDHPERHLAIGRRGRRTAPERFGPAGAVDRLLEIYRFAMEHPRSPSTRRSGDPAPDEHRRTHAHPTRNGAMA